MATVYKYNLETDFSDGINIERLEEDINDILNDLVDVIVYGDIVNINFANALSDDDKIILDDIIK